MQDIETIEAAVSESLDRIRNHPFILGAKAQELSKGQATRWIMCAGRESKSFPHILKNLIDWTENDVVRAVLEENFNDELENGDPNDAHFMHYLQLLDRLQISREDFDQYDECAGIKLALSLAFNVSLQKEEAPAIGYMLVNEAMTPITYEAAKAAITRYFPDVDTEFFDIHVSVDEHHVNELYKAVRALPDAQRGDVLFGVSIGERGMAILLDEAYGVLDACSDYSTYMAAPMVAT